jgi:PAS domain S-box-containing protein
MPVIIRVISMDPLSSLNGLSDDKKTKEQLIKELTELRKNLEDRKEKKSDTEEELDKIKWIFKKRAVKGREEKKEYRPPYGSLLGLNVSRQIVDAVGENILECIARDYLDLLDTSSAIYEKNGDYALGIFSSGWCRLLDSASRKLCNTDDNAEALRSGKWLCHEACWNEASRISIEKMAPVDIECPGGIRLYAIPIIVEGEAIGSINISYGRPPSDPKKLLEISKKFNIGVEELKKNAASYIDRPGYIIELAKNRLDNSAKLIAEIVKSSRIEKEKEELLHDFNERVKELTALHGTAKLLQLHRPLEETLKEIAAIISPAMQYPDICSVRIIFDDAEYSTPNFFKGPISISSTTLLSNGKKITIEACYPESVRNITICPFLSEEKEMLDSIVEMLVSYIESVMIGEELMKSRELLENAQRMANIGSWEWDLAGDRLYRSKIMDEIFGWENTEDKFTINDMIEAIHPDDRDEFVKAMNETLNVGKPFDIIFRLVRPDGIIRYLHDEGSIYKDEGKPIKFHGIMQDITDQYLAEEGLKRANRHMKALIKCDEALVHANDEKTLLNDICKIIVEVGGYRLAWIGYMENDANKSVKPVASDGYDDNYLKNINVTWADSEKGRGPIGMAIRTGYPYVVKDALTDPSFRPWREEAAKHGYASALGLPLINNGIAFGALAIYSDKKNVFNEDEIALLKELADDLSYGIAALRARKKIDETMLSLKEREARLNSIFRAAPVGIGLVVNRIIKDANDNLCNMLGYSREEMIDMDARLLYPSIEDYVYVGREKYRQIGIRGTGTVETKWKRKDGSIIYVLLSSTPLDLNDLSAGVTFTGLDITERKMAEEALHDAKLQAELYLDLMGHDINNMNQIGIGFLEMALDTISLKEEEKELLQKPLEVLESSTHLIDNVRKLQRIKEGGLKYHDINIGKIMREIIPKYNSIAGREVSIILEERCECHVLANDLLVDVFSNILGNSIKHSIGPLEIKAIIDKVTIRGGEYCKVSIEDNGPGIPDILKEKLFTRFDAGKIKASGRGLGLYLVKSLVEDFCGEVTVKDRISGDYSKGCKIIVTLPLIVNN